MEKEDNRKEGNFYFLRNTFKYYANLALTSTDIKLLFVFSGKKVIERNKVFLGTIRMEYTFICI